MRHQKRTLAQHRILCIEIRVISSIIPLLRGDVVLYDLEGHHTNVAKPYQSINT